MCPTQYPVSWCSVKCENQICIGSDIDDTNSGRAVNNDGSVQDYFYGHRLLKLLKAADALCLAGNLLLSEKEKNCISCAKNPCKPLSQF